MSPGISTRLLATQSDERLLGLVREGHERAFEALVNRYRKPLLNYCRRLSLPEARTEDVLQQALLKTWIALRDGADVRDIKAWLYRVVHNAAVNAVRDAVHDRERIADPTLRVGGAPADIERGLVVREALAEVAALPPLQREVIVRTAVGGYSHEQVASDLGISDGAVRGLLYRARATLRTATTALTPPPLLAWIAGRADQGGAAPERLSELAAGGGTVGLGGLLVKGGVAAVTAGTLLTGAAVVQLRSPGHHRHPRPGAVTGSLPGTGASTTGSTVAASAALSTSRLSADAHGRVRVAGSTGAAGEGDGGVALTGSPRQPRQGGSRGSTQRGAGVVQRHSGSSAPTSSGGAQEIATTQGSSTPGTQGQTGSGAGSEAPKGGPGGSAAGSGGGSEGAPGGGSGNGEQAPAGSEPAGGSTSSGSESPSPPSESGSSGGSSGSESSESGQSGGLVKTAVHEVGSVLEHLLH